jgi:hypothetical protein
MAELVESARLEIECTANKRYRGFESHSLRQFLKERPQVKDLYNNL